MNWYLEVLKKYAVFAGRAHRKEYWMFCLFMMIIGFVLGVVGALLDVLGRSGISANFLINIYILATLIPSIAVGVRRVHDTDHSGWWLLFPFVGFVLLVMKGTRGDNRFGPESNILKQEKEDSSERHFFHAEQTVNNNAPETATSDDATMEKIFREADARAVEEARRRAIYPISEVTQKDEEFIALLKSTINENGLNTIPGNDLIEIYKRARLIDDSSNTPNIELSKAVNTLLEEIKKRGLSQDSTTPQEISNYEDSSFIKEDKKPVIVKVLIAFSVAIAVPLILIYSVRIILDFSDKAAVTESNYSSDETGTKAPKAHGFDIQGFYNENRDYYGDVPLDIVARDAHRIAFSKDQPDYDTWKKSAGIEAIIQEDNDRRKPSFLDKLKKMKVPFPFRYDEESIQGRLFRFDRITRTVEQRQGIDENTFKWVPRPQFKNLQHVRDFMAQWERNRQNSRDMTDKWETERENNELKRSIEDMKDTLEAEKRERQFRDMQQGR